MLYVETEMSASFYRTAGARRKIRAVVRVGRIGTIAEIAAMAAFRVGPEAGYVTPERIAIAGGR